MGFFIAESVVSLFRQASFSWVFDRLDCNQGNGNDPLAPSKTSKLLFISEQNGLSDLKLIKLANTSFKTKLCHVTLYLQIGLYCKEVINRFFQLITSAP